MCEIVRSLPALEHVSGNLSSLKSSYATVGQYDEVSALHP